MLGKTLPDFLRGRSITSIAVVFFLREATDLAVDFAAPDELALALLLDFSNHSLVPSAAAQQSAAVHAVTCAVAQATFGTKDTYPAETKQLL